MIDFEREEWNQDAELRRLLETYHHNQLETARLNSEFDGWLPRIKDIEGIKPENLARLHGKLIALGFLKFQLVNRKAGMSYQVNTSGERALALREAAAAEAVSLEADDWPQSHSPRAAA